ncbi:hypothetical protein B0H17DRAFT_1135362 [Mycena rosella]|uniref:Uncharacterized protein n=1 Tax=Mycena rosella TaxID=1033263 RepID=A0AAD7GCY9_MYCRO|nr:hypothetical protein B0H17DRAFT_1135362 [Mycena rosella]
MVISALASPGSPFQTPLTILLAALMKFQKSLAARLMDAILTPITHTLRKFWQANGGLLSRISEPVGGVISRCGSECSRFIKTIPPLLPLFNRPTPPLTPQPPLLFDEIPPPSKAVPAIVWALEMSTDSKIVEAAAAIVLDIQWPVNLDLHRPPIRLADIIDGCFKNWRILDGMDERAIRCVRAFGLLEMVTKRQEDWTDRWTQRPFEDALKILRKTFHATLCCVLVWLQEKMLAQYKVRHVAEFEPSYSSSSLVYQSTFPWSASVYTARVRIFSESRTDKEDCDGKTSLNIGTGGKDEPRRRAS